MQERSRNWRQSVEPWYLVCALASAVTGGLAPILLPQRVILVEGNPAHVGLVMAAVGLGGLTSAMWAAVADAFRWHRGLFAGGLLATAVGLAGFPIVETDARWIVLALILGIGAGATNTVANLFIVEAYPELEWDRRIGWLQTFYNGGAMAGLVLAGGLSHLPLEGYLELDVGLLTAAALAALAALLAWWTTRTPPRPSGRGLVLHVPHAEWMHSALRFHWPSRESLKRLRSILGSPFALLLTVWMLCSVGPNAVYALYPVLMQEVFDIAPGPASVVQAVGLALGLAVYSPTGLLVHRIGPVGVLQVGLGVRLAALLGLMGLAAAAVAGRDWLAALSFTVITVGFPLLTVSSAVLVSKLSPVGAGEGMGTYNAVGQLAGLVGPLMGGYAASWAGYNAVWNIAVGGVAAAVALAVLLGRVQGRSSRPATRLTEDV